MSLQAQLDKISGAQARIEAALTAQTQAEAALATANARVLELEAATVGDNSARLVELEGQVSAITARAETAEASLATANTRVTELEASQSDFDIRLNTEAARLIAANGHAPVATQGKKTEAENGKTVTRAELNAMTPAARMSYVREGGKISAE